MRDAPATTDTDIFESRTNTSTQSTVPSLVSSSVAVASMDCFAVPSKSSKPSQSFVKGDCIPIRAITVGSLTSSASRPPQTFTPSPSHNSELLSGNNHTSQAQSNEENLNARHRRRHAEPVEDNKEHPTSLGSGTNMPTHWFGRKQLGWQYEEYIRRTSYR